MRVVYLHGFASSPASTKAKAFAGLFRPEGIELEVPDLAEGDFRTLTITRQLSVIDRVVGEAPACLMGSSLGGYLAALHAARHPQVERVVLLAPAFRFAERWIEYLGDDAIQAWRQDGFRRFFHYATGREEPLDAAFLEDALRWEPFPEVTQPALVLHGEHDDVVPVKLAREFARRRPNATLRIYDTDHQMLDVIGEMWDEIRRFLLEAPTGP